MFSIIDFQAGKGEVFDHIYNRYYTILKKTASNILHGRVGMYYGDAEDVASNAMINLFRYKDRIYGIPSIGPFLFKCVKMECFAIKHREKIKGRQKKMFASLIEEAVREDALINLERKEKEKEAKAFIQSLPEPYSEILNYFFVQGLHADEIEAMGKYSLGFIQSYKNMGIEMLRGYTNLLEDPEKKQETFDMIRSGYTIKQVSERMNISLRVVSYLQSIVPKLGVVKYSSDEGKKVFKAEMEKLERIAPLYHQIAQLYMEGKSNKEVYTQLDISEIDLSKYKKKIKERFNSVLDFSSEPNPIFWKLESQKIEEIKKVFQLKAEGMNYKKIAVVMNTTETAIKHIVRRNKNFQEVA